MQEIKISDEARAQQNFDLQDYQEFWNPAQRPGYSGTAIFVINKIKVNEPRKLGWDNEGRVQTLDFGKFFLLNIYFPHSTHELTRLGFKLEFNDKIYSYAKRLSKQKPLIICADFNVAHEEIDLARPKDNIGNPGFTDEERIWMTKFLKAGIIDTFRHFNKDKIQYTWWSYRFNARARNIGWRIDYICVSKKLIAKIQKAYILDKVKGSDHCPVGIELI